MEVEEGQVGTEQGGGVEQDTHLDRDTEAVEDTAQAPPVVQEHVDVGVEEQDGKVLGQPGVLACCM